VTSALDLCSTEATEKKVYKPDIQNKWDTLYKKPGYDVNEL
jgi:hypothetical protein